jgi:hypothetical protein
MNSAPVLDLSLPSVSFFGRTLAEYAQFFSLDLCALRDASVLDVAAGPSSFTAEACRRGIDAVAVDPLYGQSPVELKQRISTDYRAMIDQMRAKPQLFQGRSFASIDEAELSRRSAADRFVADYETHFLHGRYYSGALPLLPFFDRTFDLVLCAHFLFTYAHTFDFAFHLAACRELVRVSRVEVRLHPLVGSGARPYAELKRLRAALAAEGIVSRVQKVDYEFFNGSDSMLVLKKEAP